VIELAGDTLEVKELYKFRSIPLDSNKLHYVERIFTDNELHFPSPNDLNDPHECRPKMTVGDLGDPVYKKEYIECTLRINGKTNPNTTIKDVEADLEKQTPEQREELASGSTKEFRKMIGKELRICSFCASATNPLLWSHYADSHKGFCLVFDANDDIFNGVQEVRYQDEYPTFHYTIPSKEAMFQLSVSTKYKDWKYEQEYRLVSNEPNGLNHLPVKDKKLTFPPEMLKAVIFGCRMSEDHKELIKGWCEKRKNKIELRQAKLSDTVYDLDIENLSSI